MKTKAIPIKRILVLLWIMGGVMLGGCNSKQEVKLASGVEKSLAEYRKEVLEDIKYQLYFEIPENKAEAIPARVEIGFVYKPVKNPMDLPVDFKEDSDKIKALKVNENKVELRFEKEHLIINQKDLREGENKIEVEFIAGNEALNRREDYLYTLFVPDRARSAFPNFEQPDLKANFKLTLRVPKEWKVIANSVRKDAKVQGEVKTVEFAETEKLPTYLFSFVAGVFELAKENWRNQEIEFLYRETDTDKIEESLPRIFKEYKQYVEFFEEWTGIPYPFQKHGMVSIPDFQFGGMEHPGAILFKHSSLFLSKDATESQLNSRSKLLAHEVAHMWFGDLVTMSWFDDVWTKEVFANFMAAKATESKEDYAKNLQKFIVNHFPSAYSVDRTRGANAIHSELKNLEDANSMYGAIIYSKAPIMMQQLEILMGETEFQKGIREYLTAFQYDNASWQDLVRILDSYTDEDLLAWNEVWVNTPGRPVFKDSLLYENDRISGLRLEQLDPAHQNRIWPQSFEIQLNEQPVTVKDTSQSVEISTASISEDLKFIQYNSNGLGYGVMPLRGDFKSVAYKTDDYVARVALYINLYENALEGRYLKPEELLHLFVEGLAQEGEEHNLSLLSRYIRQLYWVFTTAENRKNKNAEIEKKIWEALEEQETENNKKVIFQLYQQIFESTEARERLYAIWKEENPPSGVQLREEDYTALVFALAVRQAVPGMLEEQESRIKNPDRKKRFSGIQPSVSPEKEERDRFFKSLKDKENRADEATLLEALTYLHHPLRHTDSEAYLQTTLELLPDIQKTNSLFFPERWLTQSFNTYRSASANQIVQDFIADHPDMNPKLVEKILQATDNLYRAQNL